MSIITGEELARGLIIAAFGGAAGLCTVALPGSALWLLPASMAAAGCALTVPELRAEVRTALPALPDLGALGGRLALPGARRQLANHAPQAEPPASNLPDENELLRTLADQPHRLIIGHTRGGKTTLIHHLATGWAAQGERVLVGDPDAAPGLWPGCEVRGHGDNIAAIGELLATVAQEVAARRQARAEGLRSFAPLHLVIDEAQDVLPALAGGLALFEDIARRGGKLNVRLTIGVQDTQVSTLGLQGKSELLKNFATADVLRAHDGRRVALLREPESGKRVRLPIPQLPDPERLIRTPAPFMDAQAALRGGFPTMPAPPARQAASAQHPAVAPSTPSDLLSELLSAPVPSAAAIHKSTRSTTSSEARITVTPSGSTAVVNVYAQAAASHSPSRWRRNRGINLRARIAKARAQLQRNKLRRAYAAARAAGLPSFRQAYKTIGGNRAEALAAWQAAAPT